MLPTLPGRYHLLVRLVGAAENRGHHRHIQEDGTEHYKIKIADLAFLSVDPVAPRQMRWQKSSPTTVCRKSAMRLAGATTLPYFMPVVK